MIQTRCHSPHPIDQEDEDAVLPSHSHPLIPHIKSKV